MGNGNGRGGLRLFFFILLLTFAFPLFSFPARDVEILSGKEYFEKVKSLLEKAKESIQVVMFEMRYYPQYPLSPTNLLIQELIKAKKRGVKVEVILDITSDFKKNSKENQEVGKILSHNGVKVIYDSLETLTHAKIVIVDHRYCVIGSHNWSYHSLTQNNEVSLLVDSPPLAEALLKWIKEVR